MNIQLTAVLQLSQPDCDIMRPLSMTCIIQATSQPYLNQIKANSFNSVKN